MKILFLTTILLSKNCNGGEVASQCFVDSLRKLGHEVLVVGYLRKGDYVEREHLKTLVVEERFTETSKAKFNSILWLLLSLMKNLAYSSAKYYSKQYTRKVKELLNQNYYDVIVIDHSQIAWLGKFITAENKLITIAHNIEHQIYQVSSANVSNPLMKLVYDREARLIKLQEDKLAAMAKQVWTLTQQDAHYFSMIKGASNVKTFLLAPDSKVHVEEQINKEFDVGLLGSWTWKANEEGLKWFLQAVYPYLPPSISIHIAGKGADWVTSKYSNIFYQGVVPDAQEFMSQAKAVAIPILRGGGIQIKTLDAIASGSSIVATPVALRGISDLPRTIRIAEQPQDFADHLVSAATSLYTQEDYNEARASYVTRRSKFVTDIDCAVATL